MVPDKSLTYSLKYRATTPVIKPNSLELKALGKMTVVSVSVPAWRLRGKFWLLPISVTGAIREVLDWISPVRIGSQGEKQQNLIIE